MITTDDLDVFRPLDQSFRIVDSDALRDVINQIADGIEGKVIRSEVTDELDGGMHHIARIVLQDGCIFADSLDGESDRQVAQSAARLMYQIMVGTMARGVTMNDIMDCLEE